MREQPTPTSGLRQMDRGDSCRPKMVSRNAASKVGNAAGAVVQPTCSNTRNCLLGSRIARRQSAGFVEIFIAVQISGETAVSKAASHFQEEIMHSLLRSAQIIPQIFRCTLRRPQRQPIMRLLNLFIIPLAASTVCAQNIIPDNPHTQKLQALVGRTIWFSPNIGCLDKISKRATDSTINRFIPTEATKLQVSELLYKDIVGYRFSIQIGEEYIGETEANLLERQVSYKPFSASAFYKTCFFSSEPSEIADELRRSDSIGFSVYSGYSPEGRAMVISRLTEFDKFLLESNRKDIERAKKPGVQIGMTKKQVREQSSWGEPLSINTTITKKGESEQWVYGNGQYLYFTRGVLSTIQK